MGNRQPVQIAKGVKIMRFTVIKVSSEEKPKGGKAFTETSEDLKIRIFILTED